MNKKEFIFKNKKIFFLILLFTLLSTAFISLVPISTKNIIENYSNLNLENVLRYGSIYIISIVLFLYFEYKKRLLLRYLVITILSRQNRKFLIRF